MDEIDLVILQKLFENSRLTYRELAELINISVSAVHKRLKKLEERTITSYIARPSINAMKYLPVLIFGTSKARSMDALSKELGQNENIISIAITGGKFLLISAYVRNISELQDYTNYVSKTAQISDPTVGIIDVPYVSFPESLTSIDYNILKTLNRDSRMSILDIADDVGLSSKTVRKRLDRMKENNLVTFSIEFSPLYKNSFITLYNIELFNGTDIKSTIQQLYKKYPLNIIICASYSNIPNSILLETWAKSPQDSHLLQKELENENFKDKIPHIFISIDWYECWIDKELRSKS